MPELPEVETIRSQLTSVLLGKTIRAVEVRSFRLFGGDPRVLTGKRVIKVRRFAKMLVIDLTGKLSLAVHFKMTGRLVYQQFPASGWQSENLPAVRLSSPSKSGKAGFKVNWDVDYPTDKHTQVVFTFINGDKLYFHDQRKFGWVKVLPTDQVEQMVFVKNLGPEPLRNLKLETFKQIVRAGARPIKLLLMDQQKLSGVGNIYANEALWCAKINPKIKANTLLHGHIVALFNCLEKTLKQAIKWKGASDNNYRDAFGAKGQVQEHFQVYNRAGRPCPRPACRQSRLPDGQAGATIQKITLGGRGTYYCPQCQAGV